MSRFDNVDYSGAPPPVRPFGERLLGAATLDATVYEEVEQYPQALGQATAVVGLVALARGLAELGGGIFLLGFLAGVLGWLVGSLIIWLIGVVILQNTSDLQELLRTLGFASAPYLLYALGVFPLGGLEPGLALAVWGLGLTAWVLAVRQALDVSTGYALGVCLVAALPNLFMVGLLSALLLLLFGSG